LLVLISSFFSFFKYFLMIFLEQLTQDPLDRFSQSFHRMTRMILTKYSALIDIWMWIINLSFILRSLKGFCCVNQLIWWAFANVKFDRLQSLCWRFETEYNIAICIRTLTPAVMQLHRVKSW